MRRPQASFESQPRAARLLAPKMGIDPYKRCTFSHQCIRSCRCAPPGGQRRPPLQGHTKTGKALAAPHKKTNAPRQSFFAPDCADFSCVTQSSAAKNLLVRNEKSSPCGAARKSPLESQRAFFIVFLCGPAFPGKAFSYAFGIVTVMLVP